MIDQKLLKELFDYENGQLIRKIKTARRTNVGDIVGTINKAGYPVVGINSKIYTIHRLIWIWHNGDIPKGIEIDHVNRERADNRIENLRLVTHQENAFNLSKVKGYYKDKRRNKWYAKICVNQKSKWLGSFDEMIDAKNAYLKAKQELHIIDTSGTYLI